MQINNKNQNPWNYYTAADVILWCPETPLSRLNFKKFKLVGVSFGGCVCNLGLVGNISADTRILKDFSHISASDLSSTLENCIKKCFLSEVPCACFLYFFTVHLSFWQLSVACVFQIVGMIMEAMRLTASLWVRQSQEEVEWGWTGKHWAKSKMKIWDTAKRYIQTYTGYRTHTFSYTYAYKTAVLHIYTQLYQSVHT